MHQTDRAPNCPTNRRRPPLAIHSFDVYDTLIGRVHADAADLHWQLAEQAAERGWIAQGVQAADGLVQARRAAEGDAWQAIGHRGAISLQAIHEHLARRLGWPAERAMASAGLEAALECAAARPLGAPLAELTGLRASGAKLCFVSDMHLGRDVLVPLLARLDLMAEDEPVFVSSDVGLSKRSGGRLYRHVASVLDVAPWRIHHHGDDWRADVLMAWRRGVRASHRPQGRLDRHERAVLAHLQDDDWRSRSAVNAARLSRLAMPPSGVDAARWSLLCGTIAPLVTGYALWLIAQAQRRGLRALFFLARDMQIVHAVCAELVRAHGLPIDCVYLHASRAAWQPAAYRGDDFDLFWLTDQPERENPVEALERLLEPDAVAALVRAGALNRRPGEARRDTVRRWLTHPAVAAAMQAAAAERRALLLAHLAQAGYTPDDRCALVDAGWRGTLQKCLARAYLANAATNQAVSPQPVVHGYYIGLRHQVKAEPGSTMVAFLDAAAVTRRGYALVALVEGFLTANHGTTLGHERAADGRVVARLGPAPVRVIARQWAEVDAACRSHARSWLDLPAADAAQRSPASGEGLAAALAAPLLQLCADPLPAEAQLFRDWYFDDGRSAARLRPLVGRAGWRDGAKLLRAFWRRSEEGDVYLSGPWLRGMFAVWPLGLRRVALALLGWPQRAA